MLSIEQFREYLPIKFRDNLQIDLVTMELLDEYIEILRTPYYENYLDFKFSDIDKYELTTLMKQQISNNLQNKKTLNEWRLLITNVKTNEIIGGCTIFLVPYSKNVEMAYFILPKYTKNGLCKHMLKILIDILYKNKDVDNIELIIREDNISSIKVAESLNFKLINTEIGKYKLNYIYSLSKGQYNA